MSTTVAKMTVEEFLTPPEDPDVHRELIEGEIVEEQMSSRNPRHAGAVAEIAYHLRTWIASQNMQNAYVGSGDVRFRLPETDNTLVGIDVGLFIGDDVPRQVGQDQYMSDPPILAVEVLSSTDTHDSVKTKSRLHLDAGVARVWIADPDFQTITVYRIDQEPQLHNRDDVVSDDPVVPAFSAPVAACFSQSTR